MPIVGINTYHGTIALIAGGVPGLSTGYPQDTHRKTGVVHRISPDLSTASRSNGDGVRAAQAWGR